MSDLQRGYLLTGGRVLLILIVAFVTIKLLHRLISRLTDHTRSEKPSRFKHIPRRKRSEVSRRREQRARAIGSVLNNTVTVFVVGLSVLLVLGQLGVNMGPVLASAGVLSVALGFGAQELVRDFMSGIAMIMEDQFGVGDEISLGVAEGDGILATGTVEAVGLRVTRLRDSDGNIWYVRNGEVSQVANMSQGD